MSKACQDGGGPNQGGPKYGQTRVLQVVCLEQDPSLDAPDNVREKSETHGVFEYSRGLHFRAQDRAFSHCSNISSEAPQQNLKPDYGLIGAEVEVQDHMRVGSSALERVVSDVAAVSQDAVCLL